MSDSAGAGQIVVWKKPWFAPVAIVVGFAALMYLSSRPAKSPEGEDIIFDAATYNTVVRKAEALSRKHFEDYDAGKSLSDQDLSDLQHAARLFDNLNRFEPTKTGPYIGAGKSYQILGQNEPAEERLRQCIANAQYDQSDAGKQSVIEAKFLLSVVEGQEGNWQQAYALANEAVHDVPASAPYLTARASAEVQLKMIPQATTDLEKALILYPNYSRAEALLRLIASSHPAPKGSVGKRPNESG